MVSRIAGLRLSSANGYRGRLASLSRACDTHALRLISETQGAARGCPGRWGCASPSQRGGRSLLSLTGHLLWEPLWLVLFAPDAAKPAWPWPLLGFAFPRRLLLFPRGSESWLGHRPPLQSLGPARRTRAPPAPHLDQVVLVLEVLNGEAHGINLLQKEGRVLHLDGA